MRTANPQPNFETLKRAFFQAFFATRFSGSIKDVSAESAILRAGIKEVVLTGKMLQPFYKRKQQFEKDFNHWLDGIDIRCASQLIDILVEQNKDVPAWMKNKKYTIDYNNNGALDLIKTQN